MSTTLTIGRATAPEQRAACMEIRMDVFVREQNVPADIEIDEHDDIALHLLALRDGRPVATARVLLKDAGATAKIGRVAVRREARGTGTGAALMRAIEAEPSLAGVREFVLESQTHAIPFYEKLGYAAEGGEYLDAGIPHRFMRKLR
ncbi:GNAT family N-acetyltransferase [Teichococcus oryzae]|uniref:GNAT family N-acetyltransferase n=1 Tax=Teichococcus oryzae TaxID=1608942 RepID=A0A5B2TJ29_9PROT|nr:GNAT family N-acetyltransferase [Pseudoroseomonas oryzae]KAA2213800.1 GNAT family N-acetyltransferase [Pseudoroseomonas oryzae]